MIDKKAYTQVYKLIEIMPEELKKNIPDTVILAIKNNMDNSYEFEIKDDDDIENMELLDDTEKILSVIYTDYIATEEEKKVIKNKERSILFKMENDKKENYTDEYVKFNKENKEKTIEENNKIAEQPKQKWYKRFLGFLKKLVNNN